MERNFCSVELLTKTKPVTSSVKFKQDNGVIRAFLSVKGRYFDLGVIRGAQDSSAQALNSKTRLLESRVFLMVENARLFGLLAIRYAL